MSPKAILASAYRAGGVPSYLFGRTQHKTLQARLSEDIVLLRDHSPFFRTAPGRYFLREFLADESIPERYRRPIPTRRRSRELTRGPVLAVDKSALEQLARENCPIDSHVIFRLLKTDHHRYEDPKQKNPESVFFRSFVCVQRDTRLLSYRVGRYREDRDSFMSKRSVGFTAFVHEDECTLFNYKTFGIIDAGARAAKVDLDIPELPASLTHLPMHFYLSHFVWSSQPSGANDILAIIHFECPTWFEPVKRRLALNDLRWIDCDHINDIEGFDPWSRIVLMQRMGLSAEQSQHLGTSEAHHRRRERAIFEGTNRKQ